MRNALSGNRSGSALLIVLGMVSFMVVSAVGFAVYMRQSRLPSSFLRRTATSHELARAALAEAMDAVDSALRAEGNAPAPNIGPASGSNRWLGRVLCPGGVNALASADNTVSPLALEELAYIPPALVNDVRYYSRRTPTAMWSRFDFDAGRAAYCVVDVSDYFDLNRVSAAVARGSDDSNLVTLSYLFQDDRYENFDAEPRKFQEFLDKVLEDGTVRGFASVADYNLALASLGSSCGVESPFARFVKGGGRSGFYGFSGTDASDSGFRAAAMQRFVTDGLSTLDAEEWIAKSGGGDDSEEPFNIRETANQPFPSLLSRDDEKRNEHSVQEVSRYIDNPFWRRFMRAIGPLEAVALYDYLDADNVPLSVVTPSVECAPMLVGVRAQNSNLSVGVKKSAESKTEEILGNVKYEHWVYEYQLEYDGRMRLFAGVAFPFKYADASSAAGCRAYAQAAFYMLQPGGVATAGGSGANGCTCGGGRPEAGALRNWPSDKLAKSATMEDGCFVMSTDPSSEVSIPGVVATEEQAASANDVMMELSDFRNANGNGFLARYYVRKEYRRNAAGGWDLDPAKTVLDPAAPGGVPVEYGMKYMDYASGEMKAIDPSQGGKFTFGLGVSVALRNADGKLVDMAPAHISDDDVKGTRAIGSNTQLANLPRALLRFDHVGDGNGVLDLSPTKAGWEAVSELAEKGTKTTLAFANEVYLTDDPRYNFAGSNWYQAGSASDRLAKMWLAGATRDRGGSSDKDRDIFMSVSGQGYLQDPGEIAFLPALSSLKSQQIDPSCMAIYNPLRNGTIPAGAGACASAGNMWRTYGCLGDLSDERETDSLRMTGGVAGFRVNPYTDDDTVRLAAFIHTPCNWWAAGNNYTPSDKQKQGFDSTTGLVKDWDALLSYTFGPKGASDTRLAADTVKELSSAVGERFRSRTDGKWYEEWKDMWKEGKVESLLSGLTLHDVDRKFLYCYWRKCFANQQQLFLVFFRAEPVVLGGGGGNGTTPAQLGAKGVAVVWRDPRGEQDRPHRMRVLYYHQVN